MYKTVIPAPESLVALTESAQGELWTNTYAYGPELALLGELLPSGFSVLDIGAAGGGFLSAVAPVSERRSALDIVRFDRLTLSTYGEFITGFLDDPSLQWSGQPYDLVTAFDIFEHLYLPSSAFANLAKLVQPGGLVLLETGNANSVKRPERWYYLSLFEHHIAWTPQSLSLAAGHHGFDVVSITPKLHKTAGERTGLVAAAKHGFYSANPWLYHRLQMACGFDGSIPPRPGQHDHMRVVLRREGSGAGFQSTGTSSPCP